MEFRNEDLLSGAELLEVFTAVSPNTKGSVVAKKLKKYLFIDKNEKMYFYRPNITYKCERYSDDHFYTVVTGFLNESYLAMDNDSKDKLRDRFETKSKFNEFITSNLSNAKVKTYESQLRTYLKEPNIMMDNYTWQLHFNNGFIDLKTGEFKNREMGKNHVTYVIDRDYKKSLVEQQNMLMTHLKKVYPKDDDRKCVISKIARCLIGMPQADQDTLFLMGTGGSGKSFMLSLTGEAIGEYLELLQSETFEAANHKRDKIFNQLADKGYIRIVWINEFSDKRIDDSDFKNFCDGTLKVTKLYQDGSFTIHLRCKLVATTNLMPNMQINTGIVRRWVGYSHTAQFVDTPDQVDEAKNIYLKDRYLLEKIKDEDNLLNAWVDILAEMCADIYNNKAPKLTANFNNTMMSVIGSNDIMQDFVDSCLKITNNVDKDRIGKEDMKRAFQAKFPDKHLTVQQLISSLKEKNIVYDGTLRCDKVKGCYIGVKFAFPADYAFEDLDNDVTQSPKQPPVEDALNQMKQAQANQIAKQPPKVNKAKPKMQNVAAKHLDYDGTSDSNSESEPVKKKSPKKCDPKNSAMMLDFFD
jgi:phage/plasmid-associated DNA primase